MKKLAPGHPSWDDYCGLGCCTTSALGAIKRGDTSPLRPLQHLRLVNRVGHLEQRIAQPSCPFQWRSRPALSRRRRSGLYRATRTWHDAEVVLGVRRSRSWPTGPGVQSSKAQARRGETHGGCTARLRSGAKMG
jgi:hypothetical protein